MADLSVAILGLNRSTASIALSLNRYMKKGGKHKFIVTAYDASAETIKQAKKMSTVTETEKRAENAVQDADIVVIGVSYEETEQIYRNIRHDLRDGVLILDMSPLKQPSLAWAEKYLSPEHHLIGMTAILNPKYLFNSKELVIEAEEDLFDNSAILLTPSASSVKEAVDLAFNFASILGSKPRFLDPLEHDTMLAQTVQLPRLLGTALFYDLAKQANWEDLKWLTNADFGALTRPLYDTHPDALRDEFYGNREALARTIDGYIETLSQFRDALREEDKYAIEAATVNAAEIYEGWINSRYKADWDVVQSPDVSSGTNMLQTIFGGKIADKIMGKDEEK